MEDAGDQEDRTRYRALSRNIAAPSLARTAANRVVDGK